LVPASGRAEQPDALSLIRAKMEEGQGLFLAGKYEEAARAFEAGYASHPYSAFLFNAGVCHQKSNHPDAAVEAFEAYLAKDPHAPDAPDVKKRLVELAALIAAQRAAAAAPPVAGETATTPPPPEIASESSMKSLVVVETEPAGAPLRLYRRLLADAAPFVAERKDNPGWELVAERTTPADLTLAVGRYHVVIDKFREFNRSETDIEVSAGHVHQFKANLSQGAFLGFLRVTCAAKNARIYLDDDGQRKSAWGTAPHGELVKPGEHSVIVEAPGYVPSEQSVVIEAGDNRELEVQLERVGHGIVRFDGTAPEIAVYEGDIFLGSWREGAPALELQLPGGTHQLHIRARGHKDLRTEIDVPRGQILPVRANMVKKYPRGTAWTQAALSVALLGASTYFAVESNNLENQLIRERELGTLTSTDSRMDQGYWYSIGANGGFALGGIFGLLATYNFIKDPYPDSELRRGKRMDFKPPVEELALPGGTK
jgi:tetratricopeptide (TPR) repeat protein